MAGTFNFNVYVTLTNGSYSFPFQKQITVTQNTLGAVEGVVSIDDSTETDIDLSSLTTPGLAFFQNCDPTDGTGHNIEIGSHNGGTWVQFALLKPGEVAVIRLAASGLTLAAKADTAAAILYYHVEND